MCLHSPITAHTSVAGHVDDELRAGSRTDGALVAWKLALGAGCVELVAADTTLVVGTFWQIPLPVGDGLVGLDFDLHFRVLLVLCGAGGWEAG